MQMEKKEKFFFLNINIAKSESCMQKKCKLKRKLKHVLSQKKILIYFLLQKELIL